MPPTPTAASTIWAYISILGVCLFAISLSFAQTRDTFEVNAPATTTTSCENKLKRCVTNNRDGEPNLIDACLSNFKTCVGATQQSSTVSVSPDAKSSLAATKATWAYMEAAASQKKR